MIMYTQVMKLVLVMCVLVRRQMDDVGFHG